MMTALGIAWVDTVGVEPLVVEVIGASTAADGAVLVGVPDQIPLVPWATLI
jgi:hypothetical protein